MAKVGTRSSLCGSASAVPALKFYYIYARRSPTRTQPGFPRGLPLLSVWCLLSLSVDCLCLLPPAFVGWSLHCTASAAAVNTVFASSAIGCLGSCCVAAVVAVVAALALAAMAVQVRAVAFSAPRWLLLLRWLCMRPGTVSFALVASFATVHCCAGLLLLRVAAQSGTVSFAITCCYLLPCSAYL